MEFITNSTAHFSEVAVAPTLGQATLMSVLCVGFFSGAHAAFEVLLRVFNTTWQGKPRVEQIEYREYCVSIIHSCIVCPLAFYGMTDAW